MKTANRAFVVDTETTGGDPLQVIELAYAPLHIAGGPVRYGEIFHQQYRPSVPIEPEAMASHHILEADLVNCPPASEAKLPASCEFIIAHSADYDWQALGKPAVNRICTLALARRYFPGGSHKLAAMMYRLLPPELARGMTREQHTAKGDLRCCAVLLAAVLDRIGPETCTTWEQLWQLSEIAREPLVWTFGKHRNQPIEDAPTGYMRWAIDNLTDPDPYLQRKLCRLIGEPERFPPPATLLTRETAAT